MAAFREVLLLLLPLDLVLVAVSAEAAAPRIGFYSGTCPRAEEIVASVVRLRAAASRDVPAQLLRLQFHDCFVQGCDGSILVDGGEKTAQPHAGVVAFDVIEEAKARLEAECPNVVSCSDIVVLAARDAVAASGGPRYDVPTGRRDTRVSNPAAAVELPDEADTFEQLRAKFHRKGFSDKDYVVLNAGHTIGFTACFFFTNRLYGPGGPDPSINPELLPRMKRTCPDGGESAVQFPLDVDSEHAFDRSYFRNIRRGFGVLRSDAEMDKDPAMRAVIDSYLVPGGPSFDQDFQDAIVRMGLVGVKTGAQGEIRKVCSKIN